VFGLAPSARFCSATFFCARKNAPHFSLSGAKKRQLQPERYAKYNPKLVGKMVKIKYLKMIKNVHLQFYQILYNYEY